MKKRMLSVLIVAAALIFAASQVMAQQAQPPAKKATAVKQAPAVKPAPTTQPTTPAPVKKKKRHKRAAVKPAPAPISQPTPAPAPAPTPAKAEPVKEKKSKVTAEDFPEKGWHRGPYLTANVGMMQITNDNHIITGRKFDGPIEPAFGLTFGWDIADWIGPMFQINYATGTSQVGDAANDSTQGGAATTYAWDPTVTFPVDTFPVQNAREHAVDISLFVKATLPYFTRAEWQPNSIKFLPYLKLGGTGHGVFVRAATPANMAGALGGGPAFGAGIEFFIWKGFFFAIDFTESLIFQKAFTKNITTTVGGVTESRPYKVTEGGLKPQAVLVGLIGWHF